MDAHHSHHLTVIPLKVRQLVAFAALILAAGCSSGGGNHASPTTAKTSTTTSGKTTSTTVPTIYGSSSHGASGLSPCARDPKDFLATRNYLGLPHALAKLNAADKGLPKTLVPIPALTVRICEYIFNGVPNPIPSLASARLAGHAASTLEDATNRLPHIDPGASPKSCVLYGRAYDFVVTFASQSEQVSIAFPTGTCGSVSNGPLATFATSTWVNQLAFAAASRTKRR